MFQSGDGGYYLCFLQPELQYLEEETNELPPLFLSLIEAQFLEQEVRLPLSRGLFH